jgi:hypothetical protein
MDEFYKATFRENGYRSWALHALENSSVPRGFKFGGCPTAAAECSSGMSYMLTWLPARSLVTLDPRRTKRERRRWV